MGRREVALASGQIYHVYNKSIAGYRIFTEQTEYSRMRDAIRYYQGEKPPLSFCRYIALKRTRKSYAAELIAKSTLKKLVEIVCYCLMPTHLHCIVRQIWENGISIFMGNALNSYSRYFNKRHSRKGPLWEGRFKSVPVATDEQLIHLTRYIHLNPVTGHLVDKPEEWPASSYREYVGEAEIGERMCDYEDLVKIEPRSYRKFVEDRISYQRELAKIKSLVIE